MLKVAMIAGEASGDLLASSLIKGIKEQYNGKVEFVGIGGKYMQHEGLTSWHRMEALSLMGLIEILKVLPSMLKLRKTVLQQLIDYNPDVFIGVDAPDFTFYLEKKLKQHGIKTVHYISPTIWAWRYNRIFKIKKSTDLMLCIFPFEEAIYHKEHIKARFIGHPLANKIELEVDTNKYRQKLNIVAGKNVFTILTGSRIKEVKTLGPILIDTCNKINSQIPNTLFVFPFANPGTKELMQEILTKHHVDFEYIITTNPLDSIKASDMVIAKSGTVSLETALCKKPMLVCYKGNKISEWVVRYSAIISHVSQPNIIAGKEIVKEFLQKDANSKAMSEYFIQLFNDKAKQTEMIAEFEKIHLELRQEASISGAQAVLDLINDVK